MSFWDDFNKAVIFSLGNATASKSFVLISKACIADTLGFQGDSGRDQRPPQIALLARFCNKIELPLLIKSMSQLNSGDFAFAFFCGNNKT
jgi:hypothetical protein